MNANELRIGDLVYKSLKSGQGRTVINPIGCQDIVRIFEDIGSFNYAPIPITEDILLKCGFEYRNENRGLGAILDFKNKEFDNWKYDMSVAFQHETDNKEIVYLHFLQHKTTNSIKYLHQLQNLYFALTQNELIIKL